MTRVVGLDLSLTSTGVCVIEDGRAVVSRIRSTGKVGASLAERSERLHLLLVDILVAVGTLDTDLVVIEGPALGAARQSGTHDRSGLWWLTVRRLHRHGLPVVEVPPASRAKYATGSGTAGKDEVLAAVVRRYPDVEVWGNDQADALVLAAMGARHLGAPIDQLPQVHLSAMSKVRWP